MALEEAVQPLAAGVLEPSQELYRSKRTVVSRRRGASGVPGTIAKLFLGPDAAARLRHEAAMLEQLRGLPGIVPLLEVGPGAMLILADTGGKTLGGHTPLAADALLDLAVRLARILAGVHQRGVLHLDISPANILRGEADGAPWLIDFHLATRSAEERRGFTHHNEIAGTLAYIAPELTGRLGQGVDQRADLYALGATLYELATGAPPFGQGDPLQLMRDLIARAPAPPLERAAGLPPLLSDIILRLLEKEPDRRYQSAEGLADDLARLQHLRARGKSTVFALGTTDFPWRLSAPSQLIAREAEMAALKTAFQDALAGDCRGLLVSGAAGVGKTALIDQLRPLVTAQGGWFVVAKFEPGREAGAADPIWQVMRSVAALLLAEPDAALAALRAALRARLGPDAGLLGAVIPEMAALIGETAPQPGATQARTDMAGLAFLRTVVSPARPLVMVFDDLHWATPATLRRVGALLAAEGLPGFLLVCAYRDGQPSAADPLAENLTRWQAVDGGVRTLRLENLPAAALADLVGEMLRLPPASAGQLAGAVGARTAGNPFDTLELLNELRHGNMLKRGAAGWQWDNREIRRHVGDAEISARLQARIAALPGATQAALSDIGCLGNEMSPAVLAAALEVPLAALEPLLSPALADGLLVRAQGGPHAQATLRFRNPRVRQALQDRLDARAQQARHLLLARRLARCAGPEAAAAAAAQYLAAAGAISAPDEARRASELFVAAAELAARTFRHDAAETYHAAAITLHEALPVPDPQTLTRLRTARLTSLYNLGRHEEADRLFAAIAQPDGDPLALAEATCVEVLSLGNRGRHREAMAIGLAMLNQLGIRRAGGDLAAAVSEGLAALPAWLAEQVQLADADRPRTDDPLIRASARLINRLLPPAQLRDPLTGAWLALESQLLWARHGLCPELVANLARSAAAPNVFGGDYRTGYAMARHAVAMGAAFGFEPETSLARQNFATFSLHWFERLEHTAVQVAAANAGLVQAGEVQAACINYIASLAALFDCAATLEQYGAELATARDFTARTGNDQLFESFHSHLQILHTLSGTADVPACLAEMPEPALMAKPLGLFGFHCSHAIIAALFGDADRLAYYSEAAMPLLSRIGGAYRCAVVSVLRALSITWEIRAAPGEAAPELPAAFDELRAWLAARAADAPANFEHLLHFIDAEAAWTKGDVAGSIRAFDRALQYCLRQTRPWHHALIAERAGLFHLAHGLDYAGRALLGDARNRYAAWGASALARRLTATHGFLDAVEDRRIAASVNSSARISADAMDMLGILRASQALSSQTTIGALHALVVETLAAMTGATSVRLLIWDAQRQGWCLPAEASMEGERVEEAAARGALPLSAVRYVERTREPLAVDDAKLDDRFARDPYFTQLPRCALLVLPVQSQGTARALLLLENRLTSGVFSQTRLDLVTLVAGQLAVSLDNAQLYASLERRVAERTEALADANRQLEALSISDWLTGLANRRRFDDMLNSEWQRALRGRSRIGLVMIDIDHFKQYNDHYGHVGGDHCLRSVAATLQASIRQSVDVPARYGGEEFALILPGADLMFAASVAARARTAVAEISQPHARSPFGIVTISLGVASMVPSSSARPEFLIEMADAALYQAKQQGRNRVICAGKMPPAA